MKTREFYCLPTVQCMLIGGSFDGIVRDTDLSGDGSIKILVSLSIRTEQMSFGSFARQMRVIHGPSGFGL